MARSSSGPVRLAVPRAQLAVSAADEPALKREARHERFANLPVVAGIFLAVRRFVALRVERFDEQDPVGARVGSAAAQPLLVGHRLYRPGILPQQVGADDAFVPGKRRQRFVDEPRVQ